MKTRAEVIARLTVSRETIERLDAYVAMLAKWNRSINLVAPQSLADVWGRHILDSAQLIRCVGQSAESWCDLGSGGGLPGLVVAILAREAYPSLRVDLVESDHRKCVFLREAARICDVVVGVQARRIETIEADADIVSARALAPLPQLLNHTARLLNPGGFALFLKGSGADAELTDARKIWQFHVEQLPSLTSLDGVILKVSDIQPREILTP